MASAYTPTQIAEYFDYIRLPKEHHQHIPPSSTGTPTPRPTLSLEFLSVLQTHQISAIPYENLSLHYSKDKQVALDPQVIFDKFVRRRRGGYCLEANIFYNHVLRALGFKVYSAGARNRLRKDGVPHGPFVGWHHMVNVVSLGDGGGGGEYMVDVGFGGDGPTKPLRLEHAVESRNLGPQTVRLVNEAMPDLVDGSKRWWVYQYRNSPAAEWNSYYAFPEVEFSTWDFDIMNFWLVNHPDCFQRLMVLIVAFVREGTEITGKLMLVDGRIKQNMGGKTELVQVVKSEAERKAALKKWFGLVLTEEEYEGIRGYCTELHDVDDCGLTS